MPHYACLTCKTRLRAAAAPAESVGDLCPQCGCPLEPAADLAALIGFRSIGSHDDSENAPSHEATVTRLDEFIVRRAERLERRRAALAAARGLGGDDPPADAVAVALVPPRAAR